MAGGKKIEEIENGGCQGPAVRLRRRVENGTHARLLIHSHLAGGLIMPRHACLKSALTRYLLPTSRVLQLFFSALVPKGSSANCFPFPSLAPIRRKKTSPEQATLSSSFRIQKSPRFLCCLCPAAALRIGGPLPVYWWALPAFPVVLVGRLHHHLLLLVFFFPRLSHLRVGATDFPDCIPCSARKEKRLSFFRARSQFVRHLCRRFLSTHFVGSKQLGRRPDPTNLFCLLLFVFSYGRLANSIRQTKGSTF